MDVEKLLNEIPTQEGLILIISELQTGKVSHDGKYKSVNTAGKIIIVNKTGGPIYDLELHLRNYEKTKLSKVVSVPVVSEYAEKPHEIEYEVEEAPIAVEVKEIFETPSDLPVITAYKGIEIPFKMTFVAKNNSSVSFKVDFERGIPEQFKLPTTLPEGFEKSADKLVAKGIEVQPQQEAKKSIDVTLFTENVSPFRSIPVTATYFAEGIAISGLDIVEVKGIPPEEHRIELNERPTEREVWDCYFIYTNKSKAPVKIIARCYIEEGDLVLPESEEELQKLPFKYYEKAPGEREYPMIEFKPVEIKPGETVKLGPFVVKNPTSPRIIGDPEVWIVPTIIKRTGGIFEIEDLEIRVVDGTAKKVTKVHHPSYISGLTEVQVAAHMKEEMHTVIEIENKGSAELDFAQIINTIPAGFEPPKPDNILVKLISEEEYELPRDKLWSFKLEPDDYDPTKEHKLTITISGVFNILRRGIKQGDKIYVEYTFNSIDPKEDTTYEFPAIIHIAPEAGFKVFEIAPEPPKIQCVPALRKIAKRKEVKPIEADVFEVLFYVVNEGQLPEERLEIKDIVPADKFELIEDSIEPAAASIDTIAGRYHITWIIEKLEPRQQIILKYRVKGKPGYKVRELLVVHG